MSSDMPPQWVSLCDPTRGPIGRLAPDTFRRLLDTARQHYQAAVDAAAQWRAVAAEIDLRSGGDGVRKRIDMNNSIQLKDITDRRNFHITMHGMVSDQIRLELEYQQFVQAFVKG